MIEVTCALIIKDKKILVTQRSGSMSLPLKWEFPGGKLEKNEKAQTCIKREILEELNLEIKVKARLSVSVHKYSEDKTIKLIPFICEIIAGELKLAEHAMFLWLEKDELINLDWAEADIPIVNEYIKYKP